MVQPTLIVVVLACTSAALCADSGLTQEQAYELFFREAVHFQKKAAADGIGNAHYLAGYHARIFQLVPAHEASLNQVATRCVSRVAAIDNEAATVIRAARDKYKDAGSGSLVPPPPALLTELQRQKTGFIREAIRDLSETFGAAEFAHFDQRVRNYVASNMNRQGRVVTIR